MFSTLRNRILASYGVILAVMLLTAVIAYLNLSRISANASDMRADALPGVAASAAMRGAWNETYVMAWQLAEASPGGDRQRLLDRSQAARTALDDNMRRYEAMIEHEDDRRTFDQFRAVRERFRTQAAPLYGSSDQLDQPAMRILLQGELHELWVEGLSLLQSMVDLNQRAADQSATQIQGAVATARRTMEAALITAILCALVLGVRLMRAVTLPMQTIVALLQAMRGGDLRPRLALHRRDEFAQLEAGFNQMTSDLTELVGQAQRSAIQVTTSVNEIAATARQQQATATETAATTAEIGATAREISATSRDLARTLTELSDAADHTSALATTGQDNLSRMEGTMQQVMDAAGAVNAKLAALNEKAGDINQVVTAIAKVADQTNLLSLNAAIEAEKAGEYGRGFAVVATEIRRLADQTAMATGDIEQTVREIQSAVAAGVMGMDKFTEEVRRGMADVAQVGNQLSQIIAQVQSHAPRMQTVNEGMHAQSSGAEQINQALMQLSEAAQQTVDSLRQSSQALDELTLVANDLRAGVARFKV